MRANLNHCKIKKQSQRRSQLKIFEGAKYFDFKRGKVFGLIHNLSSTKCQDMLYIWEVMAPFLCVRLRAEPIRLIPRKPGEIQQT